MFPMSNWKIASRTSGRSCLFGVISLVAVMVVSICPNSLSGQEAMEVPFEITGRTMGPIRYSVVIAHHPDSVSPVALQAKVDASLERVNGLMSTYIAESDVSRFNSSSSIEFQNVESETAIVVARALEISKQTDGAFDITVGPAVNLWNFGPQKSNVKLPSRASIDAVKRVVGFQHLDVRLDPPAIKKSIPALKIDLSAIAKGYAVDQVGKMLENVGCEKFMVEVGGEIMTRGERFDGGGWRIGVERPTEAGRVVDSIAEISDRALATSGDYRNSFEHDGKRYSHTIDPQTCRPVTHMLASACVVANDCMTADAVATAVMVMGAKRGRELCERLGVEYLLVERDTDFGQDLTEFVSPGFPLQVKPVNVNSEGNSEGQAIWPTFVGAAIVFGIAVLAMAVGSIFANKPVTGSCGGIANMTNEDGESDCGVCSKPTTDCVEAEQNV